MIFKKTWLLVLFAFAMLFLLPQKTSAADPPSGETILTKVQEAVQYFFTFKTENKVQFLENNAEKRLSWAQEYADDNNEEGVKNMIQSYERIKERQVNLMNKVDKDQILEFVENRTVEQQKMMEEIKTKINKDVKQEVVRVQEQVVNQIAKHIVEVNGPEGTSEFLNEIIHVWAPGTGPGGDVGHVYAGGGKVVYAEGTGPGSGGGVIIEGGQMQFAPGTSAGGPSGADIKTVEVKTGGGENNVVESGNPGGFTTSTTGNSPGNTIDPGTVDEPSDQGETWLAP